MPINKISRRNWGSKPKNVILITSADLQFVYSRYIGMEKVGKFVAFMLLAMVAGPSMYAAAFCQIGLRGPKRCSECCPTMAAMRHSVSAGRSTTDGAPCCQVSSQQQTPNPQQTLPEQSSSIVAGSNQVAGGIIPAEVKSRPSNFLRNDHRRKPRIAALFCTFLI